MNYIEAHKQKFTKEMIDESIFVIDNNCLLFPFKDFGNREVIMASLCKISDKTYIPFITQVEYLNNEEKVIKDTENMIGRSENLIENIKSQSKEIINQDNIKQLVINKLFGKSGDITNVDYMKNFKEKYEDFKASFLKDIQSETEKYVNEYNQSLYSQLEKSLDRFEWDNLKRETYSKNINNLKVEMGKWFQQVKMGGMYGIHQIDEYNNKIPKRYKEKVSPGYADIKEKENEYISLGFSKFNSSYSDAIFWLDVLEYAKQNSENKKYLIVVSNETKQDWVQDKKAEKINDDMFYECLHHTGLICKKVHIWTLMRELGGADDKVVEQSQKTFAETGYEFKLYGQDFYPKNQSQMMKMIFEAIISKVDGNQYLTIACLQKYEDEGWEQNTVFNSNERLVDKNGEEFVLGLTLSFRDKLRYIYALLEKRVQGSSPQLKFNNTEYQQQWVAFRA